MELTWDLAGQYLFLAGLFASVLGIGKAFILMTAVVSHLRKAKKGAAYATDRKKAVSLPLIQGVTEMGVGVTVMGLVWLLWPLDSEGETVITSFFAVIGILTLALFLFTSWWLKGVEE